MSKLVILPLFKINLFLEYRIWYNFEFYIQERLGAKSKQKNNLGNIDRKLG